MPTEYPARSCVAILYKTSFSCACIHIQHVAAAVYSYSYRFKTEKL